MTYSSDFDPATIIRTKSRLPKRPQLSQVEIKRRAESYLLQPPSPELLKAYRLTLTAGVLALMHLQTIVNVAPRTIRKYVELGVLERLPDRTPKLRKLGFTESHADLRLYTLGPVGHAMADMEKIIAPSGYHATVDRVTHDFLATHVVMRFLHAAEHHNYTWEWRNRYQATLKARYDKSIEPDAAVRLTHRETGKSTTFLLELHNEDHGGRVAAKLGAYANLRHWDVPDWSAWWDTACPPLLVVSPYLAPLHAYETALADVGRYHHLPRNLIYANSLRGLDREAISEHWKDLREMTWINLFTGKPAG